MVAGTLGVMLEHGTCSIGPPRGAIVAWTLGLGIENVRSELGSNALGVKEAPVT